MKILDWMCGRHWTARIIVPIALGAICGGVAFIVARECGLASYLHNVLTGTLTVACVNEYNLAQRKRKSTGKIR